MSARRRVSVCAVAGAIVGALSTLLISWQMAPLVAWDVAALTYTCWIWLVVWKLDAAQTAAHAEREDPTQAAFDALLLSAAVASLVAIGVVLIRAASATGLAEGLQAGFAVLSVLVSWSVIHTTYMLRYAALFYDGTDGGADFHQKEKPQYSDFAYLAFTVGMTFQVSDTEMNTSQFRAMVLRHSLLSYLFGTVIVALTINLVAGLTK